VPLPDRTRVGQVPACSSGEETSMTAPRRWIVLSILGWIVLAPVRAEAAAELKLSKDFLDGIIEKLPPCPFDKADQYRGSVHSFRLNAIEPRTRRLLISCQLEGEFHPPVTGPISERAGRSPNTPEGWRKFRFDVKAKVNIEPGPDGAPRFRIEIDEVKRRELDGFSGVVARFLGQYFDELVTQIAGGRASKLNRKLNDEIMKRVTLFRDYGVLSGIDYAKTEIALHFDVTRFRLEGITGHVFAVAHSDTAPLHRWLHPKNGSHHYTTTPNAPDRPNSVSDGVCCHVFSHAAPDTVAVYHCRTNRDELYTTSPTGENSRRLGFIPHGTAFYVYKDPRPDTTPLYRFYDPVRHQHFYTTHPHAEFAK
jgi:hypothetical protein